MQENNGEVLRKWIWGSKVEPIADIYFILMSMEKA